MCSSNVVKWIGKLSYLPIFGLVSSRFHGMPHLVAQYNLIEGLWVNIEVQLNLIQSQI